MRRAIFFFVVALVTSPAPADDRVDDALLAPLPIRDQFLLSQGFFFFVPQSATLPENHRWTVSLSAADANTFAKSGWIRESLARRSDRGHALDALAESRFDGVGGLFLVDGQTHRSDIAVRRTVGSHLEIGISLPVTNIGGGWSDPLIEFVHRSLRVGNGHREALRQNSETVYLRHPNGRYLRTRGSGVSLGDLTVIARYELAPLRERDVQLAVAGAVELPTGNASMLEGSGSTDAGVELVATRAFRRSRLHASLGLIFLGRSSTFGLKRQLLVTDTVAFAYRVTARSSAVVQLTVSESPFRQLRMPEFTRRSYQLSLGWQRQIGSAVVHAAFLENVLNYDNSADAGIAWGVSRRF